MKKKKGALKKNIKIDRYASIQKICFMEKYIFMRRLIQAY